MAVVSKFAEVIIEPRSSFQVAPFTTSNFSVNTKEKNSAEDLLFLVKSY